MPIFNSVRTPSSISACRNININDERFSDFSCNVFRIWSFPGCSRYHWRRNFSLNGRNGAKVMICSLSMWKRCRVFLQFFCDHAEFLEVRQSAVKMHTCDRFNLIVSAANTKSQDIVTNGRSPKTFSPLHLPPFSTSPRWPTSVYMNYNYRFPRPETPQTLFRIWMSWHRSWTENKIVFSQKDIPFPEFPHGYSTSGIRWPALCTTTFQTLHVL